MNDTPTPLFDEVDHDHHHTDIVDPGCSYCASMLRHPAGDNLAAMREAVQHRDFEAAAQAAVDAQDKAVLRRRMWLFTLAAALFIATGITLAIIVDPPAGRIMSGLVALAGVGYAMAAWDLRRPR